MLKINLLPIRQLKKRAKARNQIAAGIVIFISVLVLLGLVGILQAGRITTLNDDIAVKTKEKKSFDKVVKELADLEKKRLDLIVANDISDESIGFGSDVNRVCLIDRAGKRNDFETMSKARLAARLFDAFVPAWLAKNRYPAPGAKCGVAMRPRSPLTQRLWRSRS